MLGVRERWFAGSRIILLSEFCYRMVKVEHWSFVHRLLQCHVKLQSLSNNTGRKGKKPNFQELRPN